MGPYDLTGDHEELTGIEYRESGTGQRLPLMLCLDTSASMAGGPIRSLNEALSNWGRELSADIHLKSSVDVATVTFGSGGVRAWRGNEPLPPGSGMSPFVSATRFRAPQFPAGGVTLLTEALELAIRYTNTYKAALKRDNYQYYR
jgi:uncharacterized protein YegL